MMKPCNADKDSVEKISLRNFLSANKPFLRNSILNVFNICKGWSPVQRIYVGEKYSDNAEKAFVSGNNGIGMPYGTRLSLEKPCCKARMSNTKVKNILYFYWIEEDYHLWEQKEPGVDYSPCCHYKWFPKSFFMPKVYSLRKMKEIIENIWLYKCY